MVPVYQGFQGLYRVHRCPRCGLELSYSTVLRIIREIPPSVKTLGREGKRDETPFLHIAEFTLKFEAWFHERYLRVPHTRLGGAPDGKLASM